MTQAEADQLEGLSSLEDDIGLALAFANVETLRAQAQQLEDRLNVAKNTLKAEMAERGVRALTLHGVPVARLNRAFRQTVDGAALKVAHPRIYARFAKTTEYDRLTFP